MVPNQLITQIDLFEGLPEESVTAIAQISDEVPYSKGKLIFHEGSAAECIYILLDGEVTVQVSSTSKSESIVVASISMPFHVFGWSGLVPPYHYTASALCEADSRILAVHGEKLIEVLQTEPLTGFIVMQRISELISRRLRNSRIALLKTS